jgi:hypothetical protein
MSENPLLSEKGTVALCLSSCLNWDPHPLPPQASVAPPSRPMWGGAHSRAGGGSIQTTGQILSVEGISPFQSISALEEGGQHPVSSSYVSPIYSLCRLLNVSEVSVYNSSLPVRVTAGSLEHLYLTTPKVIFKGRPPQHFDEYHNNFIKLDDADILSGIYIFLQLLFQNFGMRSFEKQTYTKINFLIPRKNCSTFPVNLPF